jgi:peroxiredoxin
VQHHADDPEVARLGLGMDNALSRRRDAFLEGIYANARGRDAAGLARLAIAKYLEKKAVFAVSARKFPGRSSVQFETYDNKGNLVRKSASMSNEEEGYRVHLRMLDPDFLRAESERLYEEVIAKYADVPFVTADGRALEREAEELRPASASDPKKKQLLTEIEEAIAARKATLGQVAAARLDDLRNVAEGRPAPGFEGIGADGRTIRLADLRGKVVVLGYWFSSCGPCLREIPRERELVEAMKGRPFVLVGIVSDGRGDDARKVMEAERITWPTILRGGDAIADRYHVASNPAYFVIDADGALRAKGLRSAEPLREFVEPLVRAAESRRR